ncbi:CD209 antigen-like protein E [Cloeon dipterum]|uniref:CD209 antigen-like protein E n=1 Tax=Cloeon dipterum TaxID=197152 RepID=UPI00321FE5B6
MKSLCGAFFLFVGASFAFAPFCEASSHVILHGLERQQRSSITYSCDDQAYYDELARSRQAACNATLANETALPLQTKNECLQNKQELSELQRANLETCSLARSEQAINCSRDLGALSLQISECKAYCPVAPTALSLTVLSTGSYYISSASELKSWFMADKFCKSNGLELASVETIEESDALIAAFGSSSDRFWLSGTDLGSEGVFYWSGVGQFIDAFWYFEDGQPDNANGNENCVQYFVHPDFSDATYKWNDHECNAPFRFVCELESTKL